MAGEAQLERKGETRLRLELSRRVLRPASQPQTFMWIEGHIVAPAEEACDRIWINVGGGELLSSDKTEGEIEVKAERLGAANLDVEALLGDPKGYISRLAQAAGITAPNEVCIPSPDALKNNEPTRIIHITEGALASWYLIPPN